MANTYEPLTDLADRLLARNERGPRVGFGSKLFARLGIDNPFTGGSIADRALHEPRLDFLSSSAYLAELRGLSRRRFMLLERITGARRALDAHQRFQRRVATPAVRAATLGMDEGTLIDWASQVDEAPVVDDEQDLFEDEATLRERHRDAAATRALRSEIAQATGVLAQLQGLLDAQRAHVDPGLRRRISDLQQSAPADRSSGAHRIARDLKGMAAIASRAAQVGRRTETTGQRPLAVAQARQADSGESKGLRRVLGDSPVIMTLEEPAAPEVAAEPLPEQPRPERPIQVPSAEARQTHGGRVARAAAEARSQASVGRAGPPERPAATSSAQPAVTASSTSQPNPATRPTAKLARRVQAATQAPLNDIRRGVDAVRPTPASTAGVTKRGVSRVVARDEAGLADSRGRVTGATRYLRESAAQQPTYSAFDSFVATTSTREGLIRAERASLDMVPVEPIGASTPADQADQTAVGASDAMRPASPTASGRTAEASQRAPIADRATVAPRIARADARETVVLPPVARAMQRDNVAVEDGRSVAFTRPVVAPRALPRERTGVAAAVTPLLSTLAAPMADQTAEIAEPSMAAPPAASASATPSTVAGRATTPSASAPETRESTTRPTRTAARSVTTRRGAASLRAGRALPTVRAAARSASPVRWTEQGRMLSPAVSRYVEQTELPSATPRALGQGVQLVPVLAHSDATSPSETEAADVQTPTLASPVTRAALRQRQGTRASTVVPTQASASTAVERTASAPADRTVAARTARVLASDGASTRFVGSDEPVAAIGPVARAADRGRAVERSQSGRTMASPAAVVPFLQAVASPAPVDAPETSDGVAGSIERQAAGQAAPTGAPSLAATAPAQASSPAAAVAGAVDRASRRGQEPSQVLRPTSMPTVTPEAQPAVASRIAERTERRLEQAQVTPERASSPFRQTAQTETAPRTASAPVDPVVLRSVFDTVEAPVADVVQTIERRQGGFQAPSTVLAAPEVASTVDRSSSEAASTPTAARPSSAVVRAAAPRGLDAATSPTRGVEASSLRAGRRSAPRRRRLTSSPVVSSAAALGGHAFAGLLDLSALALPRPLAALSLEGAQAEGMLPTSSADVAPVAGVASRVAGVASPTAARGGDAAGPMSLARVAPTLRALDRSAPRRDAGSMLPHPVGTERTASATTRMIDRGPGAVAATEGVLVKADEAVDLRAGRAEPGIARRASSIGDGMTLALPTLGAVPETEVLRSDAEQVRTVRDTVQRLVTQAPVQRALQRDETPVVSVPAARRTVGASPRRGARYEARVVQTSAGDVVRTVLVDTVTGQKIADIPVQADASRPLTSAAGATDGPQLAALDRLPQQGEQDAARPMGIDVPTMQAAMPDAIRRAEQRADAVQTVDGRPRAQVLGQRYAQSPATVFGLPEADESVAPLGQTIADLTQRTPSERAPTLRRGTWHRRQMAHELGEFAPALAEAEFLEAPVASEGAPAWARRAVTGTSVDTPREQLRGPAAQQALGAEGLTVEGGVARAWEANSLMGALSRADAPEDLIKVIVERRTEVRTVRETLPTEAVRLVERLASLSNEEIEAIRGSRAVAAPRANLRAPSRSRRNAQDFTQLSGTNDGMGANKIMKLADKLMGLIHLAEAGRVSDAQRQLQMSQQHVDAGISADMRGSGESVDEQTMSESKLHDDVFKKLMQRMKQKFEQQGDM